MELSFLADTNACVVRGLMSEKDCAQIIRAINHQRELLTDFKISKRSSMNAKTRDFWSKKNTPIETLSDIDSKIFQSLEEQKEIAFREYLNRLDDNANYYLEKFTVTHAWASGEFLDPHRDLAAHGLVFYLNDDFDGGELYYPDHNLIITPEPGMLVLHPSNVLHGVNQITSGVRHNMTCFAFVV